MSGLDKDRFRNKTVSFRVSPEEGRQLEARIKVCGMAKSEYFIKSLLHNKISIVVGKYQSDRFSLELRRLREQMECFDENSRDEQVYTMLEDCKDLLKELWNITTNSENEDNLIPADFGRVE
ncbi:hypothetical protein [Desulfosporosinus sp.]|uniref:plasmid mobilization protein n=1 Tax=Desulfosporosinus sp. TaxID=157907 RepID=UPI00231CA072|nr:hypothetical protein [Desulfosporosinus sp.]MDA8222507.1 hypothetical protein [Desulfitobacterium hafniense]